jgi:CheY-like chemotaxis protein
VFYGGCGCDAAGMTVHTAFAEELAGPQNPDHGLLVLLGYYREFDLALLDVIDAFGEVALHEHIFILFEFEDRLAIAKSLEKLVGIKCGFGWLSHVKLSSVRTKSASVERPRTRPDAAATATWAFGRQGCCSILLTCANLENWLPLRSIGHCCSKVSDIAHVVGWATYGACPATSIKVYLPAACGSADVLVPAAVPIRGAGETILVVEDDALVRGFVIAQLQALGYSTVAVGDGGAALAYVESGQPFDLLFTDVVMPGGMTGCQLGDEVARRQPGTGILYTSGYTENAIVHRGRLGEGVLLLTKPYRKSELTRMVRLALEDAHSRILETGPIPFAEPSIGVPMPQRSMGVRALS